MMVLLVFYEKREARVTFFLINDIISPSPSLDCPSCRQVLQISLKKYNVIKIVLSMKNLTSF